MPKNKKKEKSKKSYHQDEISGFFQEDNIVFKPVIKEEKSIRVFYLLFALVIGILGGILGELYINNYFTALGFPLTDITALDKQLKKEEPQVIVFKSMENKKTDSDLNKLVETAAASIVGIFPAKENKGNVWDSVYLTTEQLGNGFILTADGWIVTTDKVVKDEGQDLRVVLADRKIFPVEDKVFDQVSGAVFLKINADNLKVVKFGERANWSVGDELLVLGNSFANGGLNVVETNLSKLSYQVIKKPTDFIQSSERFSKKALLADRVDKQLFGSPVINRSGEIIGLVYDNSAPAATTVLPSDYLEIVTKNIIALGETARPYLGVHYLDLAHTLGLPKQITEGRTRGAVLYGEKGLLPAVAADSPAAKAGLKAGDIIISVNKESVDAYRSLTELVQQYKVGDVLKMEVVFEGQKREVEVVLEGKPQE